MLVCAIIVLRLIGRRTRGMSMRKSTKIIKARGIFAGFLIFLISLIGVIQPFQASVDNVYAAPEENTVQDSSTSNESTETTNDSTNNDSGDDESDESDAKKGFTTNVCKKTLGSLGWIVCPAMEKVSEAVDWLYEKIEEFLVIKPIEATDGSPIYEIWKYCRGITNILIIIVLLIVIYSQITGLGINNYGIKRMLPKIIVMAILINLSFLICTLLVDVSNVFGNGLRSVFTSVEEATMSSMGSSAPSSSMTVSMAEMYASLAGGSVLAIGAGIIAFESGVIWMMIPVVLGAIVAVATGLITIAMRQAVVMLLVMIAPLAFVANIMPNTESLFQKWKKLLERMLVFYPMFSLLFGASSLAGFAIIMSAKDGFSLLVGMAVQIFPLFFSWKMMQMSGTFLGDINSRLRGLAAKPLARNRAWADSRRQQANIRALAVGRSPMSHLRRYMNNRSALRAKHTENLQTLRMNEANYYVQRKLAAGYDGTKTQGEAEYHKPNKYTKAAKNATTSGMLSEMATLDTAHALNEYSNYFVKDNVKESIRAAEKAGNKKLAERIKTGNKEYQRNAAAGRAFLELSRAQMTKENDEEADFNFMVKTYLDSYEGYDPNKKREKGEFSEYRHFIASSAGGLGEIGQTRVLGKILAKAAAVESNQRRDINIIANKYPHAKRDFRNMLVGYYVDDNGYATDKNGNVLEGEKYRGYLLEHDPSKLVMWDHVDAQGRKYFDWKDGDRFVTRIYADDGPAIKELLTNFDTPINDPINNLYGILAGVEPGKNGAPMNVGLRKYRTTIGRSLASFKEKNAAFSPMVSEMVKKGYIKNYAQEYLAYLDSLNKATKPGTWNMQDGDAIEMYTMLMNPKNWDEAFPTDLIRDAVNVNGDPIYGVRYENGKRIKVKADEATREELMRNIQEKYIIPAARKMVVMMSRQTQNTMDNQKAGTVEKWKELKEVFDTMWGEGKAIEEDPYKQNGDMRQITKDIRDTLYTVDADGNKQTFNVRGNGKKLNVAGGKRVGRVNHAAQIYDIYNSTLDADEYVTAVSEYCNGYKETAWISDQIQDFMVQEGYGVTKEQIHEKVEELLAYIDYD